MADCCDTCGHGQVFNAESAGCKALRYRKHGPQKSTRRIIEAVTRLGVDGATILEIGGGIGEIQLELLKRGARNAVNLELSPAYEADAQQLLSELGLSNRVERRLADIAVSPDDVEPADIVILHRVVCCYPDYEKLLAAAADHARRFLVFSHPPRHPAWRFSRVLENLQNRVKGNEFRVFLHSPRAMVDVLGNHGLRLIVTQRGVAWRIVAVGRS